MRRAGRRAAIRHHKATAAGHCAPYPVAGGDRRAYAAAMASTLHALTDLASDPARLASFWGDLLG